MKIFYADLKIFNLKEISRPERKKMQSQFGRFITDYAAKEFYNIKNREIIIKNQKPEFLNSSTCFSISHSNDIVLTVFDDYPLGVDVEFMRERDFKSLFARYGIISSDKELFYKYWTTLEARVKIQAEVRQQFTLKLNDNYMLSILSSNPDEGIKTRLKIYELKNPAAMIKPGRLINSKSLNANELSENTFAAQEIIIPPEEFLKPPAGLNTIPENFLKT